MPRTNGSEAALEKDLKAKIVELEAEITEKEARIAELTKTIAETQKKMDAFAKRLEVSAEKHSTLTADYEQLQKKREEERVTASEKIAALQQQIKTLQQQIKTLQQQLDKSQSDLLSQVEKLYEQITTKSAVVEEHLRQITETNQNLLETIVVLNAQILDQSVQAAENEDGLKEKFEKIKAQKTQKEETILHLLELQLVTSGAVNPANRLLLPSPLGGATDATQSAEGVFSAIQSAVGRAGSALFIGPPSASAEDKFFVLNVNMEAFINAWQGLNEARNGSDSTQQLPKYTTTKRTESAGIIVNETDLKALMKSYNEMYIEWFKEEHGLAVLLDNREAGWVLQHLSPKISAAAAAPAPEPVPVFTEEAIAADTAAQLAAQTQGGGDNHDPDADNQSQTRGPGFNNTYHSM